ncbi:hypothetical protein [Xenorhabdus hominickii]
MCFRCLCCKGSQYRRYLFDISESNSYRAKCIFCKAVMLPV